MTATLSIATAAWSASLASVTAWAAFRTCPRAQPPLSSSTPAASMGPACTSVLLLRPCAGHEPNLERALRSTRCASPRVRVRFLVAHVSDGAVPAVADVSADLALDGYDAMPVVTGATGPNMKAAQLARALDLEAARIDSTSNPAAHATRAEVVVVADSDVELTAEALVSLLAPLASGEAEASWIPAVETHAITRADRASARVLDSSLHSFPLLAGLDRSGMVGKLFAVRRDALDAVGGFAALVAHLGEDVELSRRLRHQGMRVHRCHAVVGSLASGRSWTDVVRRYARWMAVIRAQRTPLLASYPLIFAATPLVLALGLAAFLREGLTGALAVGLALSVRFGIAVIARRRASLPVRPDTALVDGLMADALLLAAFARALTSREVTWRGARLAIRPQGLVGRAR